MAGNGSTRSNTMDLYALFDFPETKEIDVEEVTCIDGSRDENFSPYALLGKSVRVTWPSKKKSVKPKTYHARLLKLSCKLIIFLLKQIRMYRH